MTEAIAIEEKSPELKIPVQSNRVRKTALSIPV